MRTVKPTAFPKNPELTSPRQLGEAVRAARTKAGMTLEVAALSLGLAKQTLSDIELGKETVGIGNVLRAATGLGVTLFVFPAEDKSLIQHRLKQNVHSG